MSWLAQLADLNSIDPVWDELDQKNISKLHTSAVHVWQLLQGTWAELFSVSLKSLMERMPRICEALITAKEGHFAESKA